MLTTQSHTSISYRTLAVRANVTSSLVQYYFPSLDDIFVAAVNRYAARQFDSLTASLSPPCTHPLRALWAYFWDAGSTTLLTEFMALGNHRESVRTAVAQHTEHVRRAGLDALAAKFGPRAKPDGMLSQNAMLMVITALPQLLSLEAGIGVRTAHAELVETFEHLLDFVEPMDADDT